MPTRVRVEVWRISGGGIAPDFTYIRFRVISEWFISQINIVLKIEVNAYYELIIST